MTKVKVYREPENEALIIDEDALNEYRELTKELGLQTVDESKQEMVPSVYLPLNKVQQKCLVAICPIQTDIEKYNFSTIPMEVLKVYKYAKENEMYDGYQIWYNDTLPDPLLIGWTWKTPDDKEKGYTWNKNRQLLARWGDEALEAKELFAKGRKLALEELKSRIKENMDFLTLLAKNPEGFLEKRLADEYINVPDLSLKIQSSIN